jgi:hypothetical protein
MRTVHQWPVSADSVVPALVIESDSPARDNGAGRYWFSGYTPLGHAFQERIAPPLLTYRGDRSVPWMDLRVILE